MEENQKKEDALGQKPTESELEKLSKQRDEYLAGWQRAKADFINYKKDEAKRLEHIARYGTEDLIIDLIGALDNFDLGLRALEKAGPVERGIYMIRTQIEDILKQRGLKRISVKHGEQFNPAVAESISEVESSAPPGTIIEEIEPGYTLHERVVRPARVKISKGQKSAN